MSLTAVSRTHDLTFSLLPAVRVLLLGDVLNAASYKQQCYLLQFKKVTKIKTAVRSVLKREMPAVHTF